MRIALGQINTTVGDMAGNSGKVAELARRAADRGADLIAFPELAIPGYPPRDLIERPAFVSRAEAELGRLAEATKDLSITIVAGSVSPASADSGKQAQNIAAVLRGGKEIFRQVKMLLPTYDVFDEGRYFLAGTGQAPLTIGSAEPIGITVCEDAWNDKHYWRRPLYTRDPVEELISAGARALISINASPYHMGKRAQRQQMFSALACRHNVPVVYVNQVGGNDELVFDGSSFAMNAEGELIACAASFAEDLVIVDLESGTGENHATHTDEDEACYEALVVGTRDYLTKCGFKRVLIGLSGGIDSSLTAVVAVDAVGRENVTGVAMPGPYSTGHSVTDARDMAEKLGIRFEIIPIKAGYDTMVAGLDQVFGPENKRDVTEENIQARLRGVTLMALSNKWNALVLTTGNKSELAVGYCTLYGDMCGGLAVISDVPKTLVYELSRIGSNRHGGAIPENVFVKAPSAELRENQKDSDSLPEYPVLDAILKAYVEELKPPAAIAEELSLPAELVRDIARKVDRNEYKRQQAAPGLKVTTKAFGTGRRYPIAQRFFE